MKEKSAVAKVKPSLYNFSGNNWGWVKLSELAEMLASSPLNILERYIWLSKDGDVVAIAFDKDIQLKRNGNIIPSHRCVPAGEVFRVYFQEYFYWDNAEMPCQFGGYGRPPFSEKVEDDDEEGEGESWSVINKGLLCAEFSDNDYLLIKDDFTSGGVLVKNLASAYVPAGWAMSVLETASKEVYSAKPIEVGQITAVNEQRDGLLNRYFDSVKGFIDVIGVDKAGNAL